MGDLWPLGGNIKEKWPADTGTRIRNSKLVCPTASHSKCPDCLYSRQVVATPVTLECEVCKSTALELEMREMKKAMKTLCEEVRKVKRKVCMTKPEGERKVVLQQVCVEGDVGDVGQILRKGKE